MPRTSHVATTGFLRSHVSVPDMTIQRMRPASSILVAVTALVIGLAAPAMAHQADVVAHKISGSSIAKHSIAGNRLKPHTVTSGQIAPLVWHRAKLINHWKNLTSTRPAAWAIDAQGLVHLKGEIEEGTQFHAAFTLPASARPDVSVSVPIVVSALHIGSLDIESAGPVTPEDADDFSGTASTETIMDGVVYSPR
jgi:hypothetical protein